MNETTITRQIMKNWQRQRSERLWWWKVPDYSRPGFAYSNDRAVDVVACFDGVFVGMEWKLVKTGDTLALKRVRDSQITALREIERAGGCGFLMVAVYHGPHDKVLYAIGVERWLAVVATITAKSVHIASAFPECQIKFRRVGSFVHWNFTLVEERIHANRTKHA